MSRISIQTAIIDGKQHVTVYLSDGITITERAGEKIIPTIIRATIAHNRNQRQLANAVKKSGKDFAEKFLDTLDPTNTSPRIQRFRERVDGKHISMNN